MKTSYLPGKAMYLVLALFLAPFSGAALADGAAAKVYVGAQSMTVSAPMSAGTTVIHMRVMGPDGDYVFDESSDGLTMVWTLRGQKDGAYRYEIWLKAPNDQVNEEGNTTYRTLGRTSGSVHVENGLLREGSKPAQTSRLGRQLEGLLARGLELLVPTAQAADLLASDGNPQVQFDDTDGGLNPDAWMEANENNDFNMYAGLMPLLAYDNSTGDMNLLSGKLYLASDGLGDGSGDMIGFLNTTPAREMHLVHDTPYFRIESTDSAPSTVFEMGVDSAWDFDINLVSGAATTNTGTVITIEDANGNVGIWDPNPDDPLTVHGPNGNDAKILVQNTTTTVAARTLFELQNAGNTKFNINNTNAGVQWAFTNSGTDFRISRQGSGVVELALDNSGNMTIQGTLTQNSSRQFKRGIEAVDSRQVLNKLLALPIAEWTYRNDGKVRHLGPMAEDFSAAFGLGATNKGLSTIDTSGVALAAIQGLKAEKDAEVAALQSTFEQRLDRKDAELRELKTELGKLRRLVNTLAAEAHVAALSTDK